MVDTVMSHPPDYYCMTYGDFEDDDVPASNETSKRPSEVSMEDAVRDVHGRLHQLAMENMSLNEKLSRRSDELTEARAQLRGYSGELTLSLGMFHSLVFLEFWIYCELHEFIQLDFLYFVYPLTPWISFLCGKNNQILI
ncbi:unnamed protein product [Nippostrongylus brasiliensis]|uniref:BET1-like protein n=1 Tax=Nippostrongylus brasiliensis TaxID=27835 RepID=A0A0N4XHV9_NIPBR|nr:unnamed protein product [Nippostrongylus brasiliensis]